MTIPPPTREPAATLVAGVGLGPATEDEMAAVVAHDWLFTGLCDLLARRGVYFRTAVGYEEGHTLHLIGVSYALSAKQAEVSTTNIEDPRVSAWFVGAQAIQSRWTHGSTEKRAEEAAKALGELAQGRHHTAYSNALSWDPARTMGGGSLLMGMQRLVVDMWWDERMAAGYSPHDASMMLGLVLPPATAALVTLVYPGSDSGGDEDGPRPYIRYPDDPA